MARLPADRSAVTRALALAFAFALDARIGSEATDKLAVIVEEWVANVCEHGGCAADSRIVLTLSRTAEAVIFTCTDAGTFYDPRDAVFEGPNLERGGGVGLELIRAWSRIVAYTRKAGRNRLVLEMPLA